MFTLINLNTDEPTNLFFDGKFTFQGEKQTKINIVTWVAENLGHFDLRESWSCTVSFDEEDDIIGIRGDEDMLNIQIVHLDKKVIKV